MSDYACAIQSRANKLPIYILLIKILYEKQRNETGNTGL